MTGAWPLTFTCGHHLRQLLGAAGDAFDATCIYCRVTSILAAGRALKAECRVPTEKIVGFCKRGKERGETSIVTEGARPPWENPCPRTGEGEDRPARGGRLSCCLAAVPGRGFRALGDGWVTFCHQGLGLAAETSPPGLSGPTQPLPRTTQRRAGRRGAEGDFFLS